jgi:hypothetical protein
MGIFNNSSLRNLAGIFLVMVLICVFLSIYFLQYIPSEQINFHHSSFLELKQFESALQERNDAYAKAIQNAFRYRDNTTVPGEYSIDLSTIAKRFNFVDYHNNGNPVFKGNQKDSFCLSKICLKKNGLTNKWEIEYRVSAKKDSPVAGFRKNVDTLVTALVASYRDIFDDYLIIRDNHLNKLDTVPGEENDSNLPDSADHLHDGEIIYNSGNLSVDYLVNTDSLLKKNEGFSLLNIHNVIIEGNAYKLFLYPIRLGQERLILAGLISLDRYNAQFRKIPFNLIALVCVLILLILINLPVLKIYNLGPYERINDLDIRLLIGTYFVSAFIGFFLFSNSFLSRTETVKTHEELNTFADKINNNFVSEIDSICTQLRRFDTALCVKSIMDRGETLQDMIDYNSRKFSKQNVANIDYLLRPSAYPYLNQVFWIQSNGRWKTSWGFKKNYRREPRLDVSDRQYFNDFIYKRYLKLPGNPRFTGEFTIQPTLSKLDGEYTISVIIKSGIDDEKLPKADKGTDTLKPIMLGLGSDMNFVSNAIPAQGFNFCIISDNGDVLYDSKPGRALLSNIFRVVDRPNDLNQCARYRSEKYFDKILLRGRQVSMLSVPLKGFPYTLLVYYKIADTEDIHVHLIAVSASIIAGILLLLLFSSLINEWSGKKRGLLQFPRLHFEWLSPDTTKKMYYHHLSCWMSALFIFFALWWVTIEWFCNSACEFSLFYVSVLFPFFVAIQYFMIRKENYQYQPVEKKNTTNWPLPSWWLLGFLGLVIFIINAFGINAGFIWQLLVPELGFLIVIACAVIQFKNNSSDDQKETPSAKSEKITVDSKNANELMLNPFSIAIMIGIFLISIVPALGIYAVLLRQETSLQSGFSQIEMTRQINSRRIQYNQRIKQDSSFIFAEDLYSPLLDSLKFSYGIYTLDSYRIKVEDSGMAKTSMVQIVSPGYLRLHNYFFPESGISESTGSALSNNLDSAWYFFIDSRDSIKNSEFIYQNEQDGDNKGLVGQIQSPEASLTATGMLFHELGLTGSLYTILYFACILICIGSSFFLTRSLARRIFLIDFIDWKARVGTYIFNSVKTSGNQKEFITLDQERQMLINTKEKNYLWTGNEEAILDSGDSLENIYENIWKELNGREKFMLFDFATDGFANYRNANIIYGLIKKGILVFQEGRLGMMTLSFREFVLSKRSDNAIIDLADQAKKLDSWKKIKIPLLLVLSILGLFIFFTQDLIYQKITGLLTSIGTILPLLGSLFTKNNNEPDNEDEKKREESK